MLYSYIVVSNLQKENQMSYKLLFVLNALAALVFGVAFLVVPTMALQRFGVD